MTKTDMITRLGELSGLLGRDIDTSGTVAELEMRLLEAEEELASLPGGDGGSGTPAAGGAATRPAPEPTPAPAGGVPIRTTQTLHLNILSQGRWKGEVVKPGRDVIVPAADADALKGLVVRI